jgi:regulator of sigma E protease
MTIFWNLMMFLIAITPLVLVHELGHYGMARLCKVRCTIFSIGFGRALLSRTDKHGTEWRLSLLPIGGYVRFAGDMDATGTPAPVQPDGSLLNAKLYRRVLVVLAGPVANILLAWLMFSAIMLAQGIPVRDANGQDTLSRTIERVEAHSPAAQAGLMAQDDIVMLNGQNIESGTAFRALMRPLAGKPLHLVVARHGHSVSLDFLAGRKQETRDGQNMTRGYIGVEFRLATQAMPLWKAPYYGAQFTWAMFSMIAQGIAQIFTGQTPLSGISGPVGVAQTAGSVAQLGLESFLYFTAYLSVNLGFMNLLPLPALDGGHLALYGLEALRRKPLEAKLQARLLTYGVFFMLMLFTLVTLKDLWAI